MKRVISFPQVVLGVVFGGAVFPGWVLVSNNLDHLAEAAPLFLATAAWVIHFDVFYATQVCDGLTPFELLLTVCRFIGQRGRQETWSKIPSSASW